MVSLLLVLFLLPPNNQLNITMPLEEWVSVGKELATQTPPILPPIDHQKYDDTISWEFMDSLSFVEPLMPNSFFALTSVPWQIIYSIEPDTLSSVAQLAVSLAPVRFRNDLIAAFHRLGGLQDSYAQIILGASANCIDEVVYQIAHIGPEILSYPGFDPDLITLNAELMYEIDDSLQYADIIDYNLGGGDYYSTVRYRVLENSDSVWIELPWEIYYQYVVHPIITDEFPDMSSYVYSKFWREYLFYDADSTYPKLCEKIKDAKILWNGQMVILLPGRPFTPTDCALDVIGNWVSRTVPWAASGNRPIQPNIIAHEHNGNCGELQDLLTSASRTCLIACVGTNDPCEDHVWSEFYDQGFYPYQVDLGFGVTHLADTGVAYDEQHGGSKRVSAIYDWRGDGLWWTRTDVYSNYCSLYVYVYDLMGRPIDGANVRIASEGYYGGISTSTRGFTDPDGECRFALGDLRNFYANVSTPIGSYPTDPNGVIQIIENSQTGAKYYKVFYMANYLPTLMFSDTTNPDSLSILKYEVVLDSLSGQSSGTSITRYGQGDSIYIYRSFFEKYCQGDIDLISVDDANLQKYLDGDQFKAFDHASMNQGMHTFIVHGSPIYNLIVSNQDVLYYTPFCNLKFNLYKNSQYGVAEVIKEKTLVQKLPTIYKGKLLFSLSEPSQIKVYEVSGRLIYDSKQKIDRVDKSLSAGIYFMRITMNGKNQIDKFVVVK